MAAKQCTKCGETKPRDQFYRSKSRDGVAARCKVCVGADNAAYVEARNYVAPSEIKRRGETAIRKAARRYFLIWKECRLCGRTKHATKFGAKSGSQTQENRCYACRAARGRTPGAKAREAEKRRANPEFNRKRYQRERERRNRRLAAGKKARPYEVRWKEYARAAAKRGREYWPPGLTGAAERGQRPERDGYENLVAQNAGQAWSYWVRQKAPGWWMREAYRDKPWNNPRITSTQKWRIRYWCDATFRAREIEKVQRTKVKRRAQIDATDDGTLTGSVIVGLFAAAKRCVYCGQVMRSVDKSMDHVVPLHRGGAHSITNVVIACKPCNFSKRTKLLSEWQGRAA